MHPSCCFIVKASKLCSLYAQGCSSLPFTLSLFIAVLHLSLLPYLLLVFSTSICLPNAFCWPFNSRQETLLEGEFAIYFWRQKKKRKGALVLCIFSPFCLLFLRIFALSTIVVPLHPTQASMPSLCPWGERNRRAWLAKCVRDWDSTAEDEFSTVSFISLPYIDKHSRANT